MSEAAELRLLRLLALGEGTLDERGTLRVVGPDGLRRSRPDGDTLRALVERGEIEHRGEARDRLAITAAGRARLARRERLGDLDGFRLQHGAVAPVSVGEGETVVVDGAESPLAWLARRRDRDGKAYLSPARVAAGERLRGDFTLARMMPTVTSNWSTGRITGGSGTGGVGDLTDRSIAARDRVQAALAATGSDLGGLLVDVCCFLKGLERVESERRWPARSAKVVLDIALGRLADHYGLADEARGRDAPGRLRHWGTPDHRPKERRAPPP